MLNITKILFRRGLDIIRRTGGGDGVVLHSGEPGFNVDTKRVYIGDGTRIGGYPVGAKVHGALSAISGSGPLGWNLNTYISLTSNGVDTGDLLFDRTTSIFYYVSSKGLSGPSTDAAIASGGLSAVPNVSELVRFDLISQLSAANGLSARKDNNYATYMLNPDYFTLDASNNLFTFKNPLGVTINGNLYLSGGFFTSEPARFNGEVTVGGPLYVSGGIVTLPGTAGYGSLYWTSTYTNVNANSAAWQSATTTLQGLTPLPWARQASTDTDNEYIYTNNNIGDSVIAHVAINRQSVNPDLKGLVVAGDTGNTTAVSLSVIGGINATGDITAFATSDERLKKNIKPIENALYKVMQLDGVEFDWNCEYKSGHDIGVLAQQVEKVVPEVVCIREDGYKAVRYEKLIALLIQAIKELAQKK